MTEPDPETAAFVELMNLVHGELVRVLGDCPDNGDPDVVVCCDIARAVSDAGWKKRAVPES